MQAPTLCAHYGEELRCAFFREEHFGVPCAFWGRVTREDWARIRAAHLERSKSFESEQARFRAMGGLSPVASTPGRPIGQFFHALKF